MEHPKFEIEHVYDFDHSAEAIISMLTGLNLSEVCPHVSTQRLTGSAFKNIIQKLGFNTNQRFIDFNPETKYPCIMRVLQKGYNNGWYAFVYYNQQVYWGCSPIVMPFTEFIELYSDCRVTSMLQVWI